MRETIIRFFLLEPINEHPLIFWGMVVVWLMLLGACMMSLRQQFGLSVSGRWVWFLVILLLPVVGMALYLLRCIVMADYSFLKFLFGPPSRVKKSMQSPGK
jgi:hypothetical protein